MLYFEKLLLFKPTAKYVEFIDIITKLTILKFKYFYKATSIKYIPQIYTFKTNSWEKIVFHQMREYMAIPILSPYGNFMLTTNIV